MEQETVLVLFDRYADMVYRIALSYLRSPQEAEDVVQTVFLKLLESSMIIYPGKERAFLTKVTINHCKNLLTAAKKHEAISLDEVVLSVQPENRDIVHAVMELPEKYRAVPRLLIRKHEKVSKINVFKGREHGTKSKNLILTGTKGADVKISALFLSPRHRQPPYGVFSYPYLYPPEKCIN